VLSLSAGSASELFAVACAAVVADGQPVAPRGRATVEVLGAHLRLTEPRRRLVGLAPVRVVNAAFAAAETVWILSGSDAEWIYAYNSRLVEFTDGGRLMGAYGPRLRGWAGVDQLDVARRRLLRDQGSRRAVIQLYDPARDSGAHKDVPCTLNYRFYLRGGRLEMHTSMRSQDLWLGFGYDIFTATVLHELMAGWLGVNLGSYHHHVDSLHLYAEHLDAARTLPAAVEPGPMMPSLRTPWDGFDTVLHQVQGGELPVRAGWAEFAQVMRSYRVWKAGDRADARTLAAAADGPLARGLESWYDHLDRRRELAPTVGGRQ
jgi:thymidylate synthase